MSYDRPVAFVEIDISSIRESMDEILKGKQRYISLLTFQALVKRDQAWVNGKTVKNFMGRDVKQYDKEYESFFKSLDAAIKSPLWTKTHYYRMILDYETSPNLFLSHNHLLKIIQEDTLPTYIVNMDAMVYVDIVKFHHFGSMTREEFFAYANNSIV